MLFEIAQRGKTAKSRLVVDQRGSLTRLVKARRISLTLYPQEWAMGETEECAERSNPVLTLAYVQAASSNAADWTVCWGVAW